MKIKFFTLPNILTLMNLLCGSLAIVGMITLPVGDALRAALLLMLASALFDFFDGFAARLTKQYSELGVQLDSLADMVSFGLLPSIIALQVYYLSGGYGWWGIICFSVVLCSALRLAKFNIDDSQKQEFEGLPTPANALLIASLGWYASTHMSLVATSWVSWGILALCLVLSWLLISRVRMFSLKFEGFGFAKNAIRYSFLLASLVFIIIFGLTGIALSVILYILTSLILYLACPAKRQRTK